ncbi:MAG TPA: ComEC/Rec2 family competence protein [Caulobacteraceae bacterium]
MPRLRVPSLAEIWRRLTQEVADQWERVLLWTPVAFGVGAAAYLGLKAEPTIVIALALALSTCAAAMAARRFSTSRWTLAVSGLVATACIGFLIAKLHSNAVAAPIAPTGVRVIEGFVVDIESPSERGPRLLIAPVSISGLTPERTPVRVRIVTPVPGGPDTTPPPGSMIRMLALLDPPPGPAAPGAYDFARDAWFEGVGGVGLALKPVDAINLSSPPLMLRIEMAMNSVRWTVAAHLAHAIRQTLGPHDGGAAGLAAAVTTSHQDWLAGGDRDALRGSGLAHMLAIAGLHTAAVSGFAFFFFRLLIAAWPWLALRVSGKKVAAVAALVVVIAYLLLSGAHPPARRAAITASVAFVAILADRRAVSLHSLAVAALAVLLIEPEAVLQPGFEMSFCATASLIAMSEVWPHRQVAVDLPWPIAMLQKGRDWLIAMIMVSLVAGAATGPFAIQHFNRVANYGVVANLTADFIASAILMPLLALCLAAQSLGLGAEQIGPLYWAAGWAARSVISIGHLFSGAPGAAVTMASAPPLALAVSYAGIVFACLWRGVLRWIGLPMAFAVALWPRPAPPAAWISNDGSDAAIVIGGGAVALKPSTHLYAVQTWAQRRNLSLPADPETALASLYDCDRSACVPRAGLKPAIAAWWTKRVPKPERLARLCEGADFLILRAATSLPSACRDVRILGRSAFDREGAAEIYPTGSGWRIVWSQPLRGERPWSVSDSAE